MDSYHQAHKDDPAYKERKRRESLDYLELHK